MKASGRAKAVIKDFQGHDVRLVGASTLTPLLSTDAIEDDDWVMLKDFFDVQCVFH